MEEVLASLIPDIHSQLEGHIAIGFPLRCHRRESVPDLLTSSVNVIKLNTYLIASEGTVVYVEELARHGWRPLARITPEQHSVPRMVA